MKWSALIVVPTVAVLLFASPGCDSADDAPPVSQTPATPPATKPIIPLVQLADWCPEHSMPESICVQCNRSLAAQFKAKGDWDEAHNLPKSQCFECDPSLKDKFVTAYTEKHGKAPPAEGGAHEHEHGDGEADHAK